MLRRAIADKERGLGNENISAPDDVLAKIAAYANGDARAAYNTLDALTRSASPAEDGTRTLSVALLEQTLQRKFLLYDKSGEEHFNLISALHKAVRNSDPDASLYWLTRMLESGEDPMYLARRMVRMASEDIGLAEPGALAMTIAAMNAMDFLAHPKVISRSRRPRCICRSRQNRTRCTPPMELSTRNCSRRAAEPVPLHLRNAVTGLMAHVGYGRGYEYAHDYEGKVTSMSCLPGFARGAYLLSPYRSGFRAAASAAA